MYYLNNSLYLILNHKFEELLLIILYKLVKEIEITY